MHKSFNKLLTGYQLFRERYAIGDQSIMQHLAYHGQKPSIMIIACCDSRVDPALILQCEPGDLFVVRNVANIVPPYENDETHHGTSAALEFGVRFLEVKHLILLGHTQCGGINTLLQQTAHKNDFISKWVSLIETAEVGHAQADDYAKFALHQSYQNCLSFPWISEKLFQNKLIIHLWFFDIKMGQIFAYSEKEKEYLPL